MKYKYIKEGKLSFRGKQYRKGDVLDALGDLPADWFEAIEEEAVEVIEKPEVVETKKTRAKKKEEIEYGDKESTDEDLGS